MLLSPYLILLTFLQLLFSDAYQHSYKWPRLMQIYLQTDKSFNISPAAQAQEFYQHYRQEIYIYEMKRMKILPVRLIVLFIFFSFCCFNSFCLAANVTYDHRSLIIDGRRKLFLSASIHYPRSVPAVSHHSISRPLIFIRWINNLDSL